jgi:hypothetical protein
MPDHDWQLVEFAGAARLEARLPKVNFSPPGAAAAVAFTVFALLMPETAELETVAAPSRQLRLRNANVQALAYIYTPAGRRRSGSLGHFRPHGHCRAPPRASARPGCTPPPARRRAHSHRRSGRAGGWNRRCIRARRPRSGRCGGEPDGACHAALDHGRDLGYTEIMGDTSTRLPKAREGFDPVR